MPVVETIVTVVCWIYALQLNEAMQPVGLVRPPGAVVNIRELKKQGGLDKNQKPVYTRNKAYE